MKIALVDASSAILLYKSNLLQPMSEICRLTVVPSVMREIAVDGRPGADAFMEHQRSGVLAITDTGKGLSDSIDRPLGAGERDTLHAFKNGRGDFVIIDDGKGAAVCRDAQIPYVNALLCPKLLYWSGVIDRHTQAAATRVVLDVGRYSAQVVQWAHACTVESLAFFIAAPPV